MEDKLIRYLRKSYFSVDGLWFLQVEEEDGFDKALKLDKKVWKVMPKIQAREVKKILNIKEDGLKALGKALLFKFKAEGYKAEGCYKENLLKIKILHCPWYEILKRSGRTHLKEKIVKEICLPEFRCWAQEFGSNIGCEFEEHMCLGKTYCELVYQGV